jgi:hypothetical protein
MLILRKLKLAGDDARAFALRGRLQRTLVACRFAHETLQLPNSTRDFRSSFAAEWRPLREIGVSTF